MSDAKIVKPVLLIDEPTMRDCASCLQHLLTSLVSDSCPSALVCPIHAGANAIISPLVKLIYHPMLNLPFLWRQNQRIVLERLADFKPTVLHCFSPSKVGVTQFLAGELDIPYILSFHTARKVYPAKAIRDSHCAGLVGSSQIIGDYLVKKYRGFAGLIEQVRFGTFAEDDCACFADCNRVTSMVIAQRLDDADAFEPLLSAIRHLAIDGHDFILAIIGRGPAERRIHKMINSLGLAHNVTVVPEINQLREVMSGADIYILPPGKVDFNPHLLDAMSVGMAVAAEKNTSEDMIIDGKTAAVFDPADELSVYSCLQKLFTNHEFARQIAANGQGHIRRHHGVSVMTEAMRKVYNDAMRWYTRDI